MLRLRFDAVDRRGPVVYPGCKRRVSILAPVGTVTTDRHDLAYSFSQRKKPNNLEMAEFNRIDGFSIAACQLIDTKVVRDGHILWRWRDEFLSEKLFKRKFFLITDYPDLV